MKIELRPLAEIKPYENNPRLNDQAVDAVAESIRQFGFRQPIVVDEAGVIVVGHTRWKAAQKLGLTEAPVHVARDMSSEQVRAYRIADNKTAELADWNFELLPLELAELQGAGIDWSVMGWDEKEIERMLAPLSGEALPERAAGREYDESVAEGVKMVACPRCGHEFPQQESAEREERPDARFQQAVSTSARRCLEPSPGAPLGRRPDRDQHVRGLRGLVAGIFDGRIS